MSDDAPLTFQEHTAMAQTIFTPAEAADYLRISGRTLQSLRNLNQGPAFFKVKGSFRYTKAALDEYIAKHTIIMDNAGNEKKTKKAKKTAQIRKS
ncbi:helix-turn-helix domain-containing protein [Mailhella sp.]